MIFILASLQVITSTRIRWYKDMSWIITVRVHLQQILSANLNNSVIIITLAVMSSIETLDHIIKSFHEDTFPIQWLQGHYYAALLITLPVRRCWFSKFSTTWKFGKFENQIADGINNYIVESSKFKLQHLLALQDKSIWNMIKVIKIFKNWGLAHTITNDDH